MSLSNGGSSFAISEKTYPVYALLFPQSKVMIHWKTYPLNHKCFPYPCSKIIFKSASFQNFVPFFYRFFFWQPKIELSQIVLTFLKLNKLSAFFEIPLILFLILHLNMISRKGKISLKISSCPLIFLWHYLMVVRAFQSLKIRIPFGHCCFINLMLWFTEKSVR